MLELSLAKFPNLSQLFLGKKYFQNSSSETIKRYKEATVQKASGTKSQRCKRQAVQKSSGTWYNERKNLPTRW